MRTHNILQVEENQKVIPVMPPDLVLNSSNYPCLGHIFMILNVFKPLKFYCNSKQVNYFH